MKRWLFQSVVVAHLIVALGAHWTLLQTAAWVGMILDYSESAPLATALKKTFDGQHPCQMCLSIQKGKQSERERDLKKAHGPSDGCCPRMSRELFPLVLEALAVRAEGWRSHAADPPIPPPPLAA